MLLERLSQYDLEELEREKHPTQEMVIALIQKLRTIEAENNKTQLELTSLHETLEDAEIDL